MNDKEQKKRENERMTLLIFGGLLGLFVGLSGEIVNISIYKWAEEVGTWYIVFHNTAIFAVTFYLFTLLADKINANLEGESTKRQIFSKSNLIKLLVALFFATVFAYMYDSDGLRDFLNLTYG